VGRTKTEELPVQQLLEGEYLRVTRLHQYLSGLSVVPHRHDHYELLFITQGEGRHAINFNSYEIKANRLYFLYPGQVHLIDPFNRDGWLILFGEELFAKFQAVHPYEAAYGLLNSYTSWPYIDLDEKLARVVPQLIEQLRTEMLTDQQNVDVLFHYVSLVLLYANKAHTAQHPLESTSAADRHVFHKLRQTIDGHFKQEHSAAFYADSLGMDIKKLNRICRNTTGLTVFGFLQERLVTENKIQLQTAADSVKEISYALGFKDPAFFGRFFKKYARLTPAEFRNVRVI
jgi:AraC family transcriptional activator of pobA